MSQVAGLLVDLHIEEAHSVNAQHVAGAPLLKLVVSSMLGRDARLFFVNPPTKKNGTIPEFDTFELANCKKRGRVAISERHFKKVESDHSGFLVDQFPDRVHTFDIYSSTHTQHDGILPADEPFDPEGHWHRLPAEPQVTARMCID